MKKLSIIIPVYNEAPFLRRCLDSVSNAPDDVEIIVIDDASTDGSTEICAEYAKRFDDTRFHFVFFMLNRGVSYARNYGLSVAEGKYVTFLDSDDEMRVGGIPSMLYHVDKTDKPVIQFNHSRYYQRTGTIVTKYVNKKGEYDYNLLPQLWCMVWNKIYLREFIVKNMIMFKDRLPFGEDELFNLRCLKCHPTIYCVDEITVIKHFENQQSICHTLNKDKILGQAEALTRLLREDCSDEFADLVRRVLAEHWASEPYKSNLKGGKTS
jgi:glycosyltransferase involved in cell wall biosynthesis